MTVKEAIIQLLDYEGSLELVIESPGGPLRVRALIPVSTIGVVALRQEVRAHSPQDLDPQGTGICVEIS